MNMQDMKKNKSAMTPCYTAPELFSENRGYSYHTDIWAIGCILFELATGQVPFFDESVNKLMAKIINENVNFNKKELMIFSDEFIDLLKGLLEKDIDKRITWNELEKHPFFDFSDYDAEFDRISSGRSSKPTMTKTIDISKSKNAVKSIVEDNNYQRNNKNHSTIPYIRLPTFPAPHRLKNSKNALQPFRPSSDTSNHQKPRIS